MKTGFKKIFFAAVILLLAKSNYYSQFTVTSTSACPNQTATLAASWNNVGSITYTISRAGSAATVQTSPNFVVSNSAAGGTDIIYTFTAQGTALSGPVTATATATLSIIAPVPLVLSQSNQINANSGDYCHNGTATITAPIGSSFNYSITGPPGTNFPPSTSNIINISNLTAAINTGQYTVTANYSGCVRTGVTTINVAPNSQISIISPQNVCHGQTAPVTLTASITNAVTGSFFWTRPNGALVNNTSVTLPVAPATSIQYAVDNGVYVANATFSFNTATCPRVASTTVTVVQTSSLSLSASPSKTLCQGANVNLSTSLLSTVSGTPGFSWAGPFYNSSVRNPLLTGLVPINTGIYTVTALFFNNFLTCTTTQTIDISVIATADPNPIATPNVCQGSAVSLSVSATGAPTFSWSGPNSFTALGAAPTISTQIQPIQSGPYFVTATYGSISTTTCPKTRSVVVNVVPVNTISIIPAADVCQPNNAFLQASAIGATSFTWTGPNGYVGSTANVTIYRPSTSATGIYTVNMGFGGSALTCYNSGTVSLTVKPLLSFTLAQFSAPMCYDTPLNIAGPPGATSYSWTSSSGRTSSLQNLNIPSLKPDDSGDYILTVSLNGCITTASTSIDVLEPYKIINPYEKHVICRGDSIHLTAHVDVGKGSSDPACTWDPPAYLSTPNGTATTGMPLGTTYYTAFIHDPACYDYTVTALVEVIVNQPPTPHIVLERTESCQPLCQFYDTQTHGTSTLVTYDFGGNKKFQLDSSQICLEEPGTYSLNVHLYGVNGCTVSYNYPNPITVYPKPAAEILVSPEHPTITDEVSFTALTKYPVISYNWLMSNSMLAAPDTMEVQSFNKIYGEPGRYPVLLITSTEHGCADTIIKYLDVREDYNVFMPNTFTPNGDNVNDLYQVKGSSLRTDGFSLEVLNRWGKSIYFTKDLNEGWDGTINGQKAPVDVYIYKVRVIGANGEGRKEYVGYFSLVR